MDEAAKSKKRVLVVDDEPSMLRFIRVSLTVSGYEVITTTSGQEALRLVESEKPDIMLLDILMAPVTGFDVLERLRAFSEMPVIVFTAQSRITKQALELGASDSIGKPFRPDELVTRIRAIIGS